MKRKWLQILAYAVVAISLCACDNDPDQAAATAESGDWTVQVTCDKGLRVDSVTLYVLNADYGRLQLVLRDTTAKGEGWTFSGQVSEPQIAVLRVADVKQPLCFILEPCLTSINLGKQGIVVWGGKLNHYYMSQAALADSMQRTLRQLRRQYNQALMDSSLTHKREMHILGQDKRISERRQQLLLQLMRRADLVGRLMRDQYFSQLDSAHMRQL